jgi:dTDP-4-amino-4,6-dideoxygalactose transaminase
MALPVTETLAKRFLSLPIYPELETSQIDAVVRALDNAVAAETA